MILRIGILEDFGVAERSVFEENMEQASLVDDVGLSRTRELTWTTELLRLLRDALVRSIESWESFDDGELQYFHDEEQQTLRKSWDMYLAEIEKDMSELRSLRRILQQKIETFDNMKDGVRELRISDSGLCD
ncbi:MAG: hypothetical protein Q9187_004859 [Circinaria calcarea]